MFTDKELMPFGLVWSNWRVYWGLEYGMFVGWPDWFKQAIVSVWAWLSCRYLGHELLTDYVDTVPTVKNYGWPDNNEDDVYDPYCLHCSKYVGV